MQKLDNDAKTLGLCAEQKQNLTLFLVLASLVRTFSNAEEVKKQRRCDQKDDWSPSMWAGGGLASFFLPVLFCCSEHTHRFPPPHPKVFLRWKWLKGCVDLHIGHQTQAPLPRP